ncbi:hypothetical protein AYI70_g1771 [Smittium culicis]|uniref:DNA damage-inducible protein 1 n=1 Tax=Smittium culicis TaxID=133412 RepID=A0A1R1YBC6_9FUNG|nr:hypothetical protein AYI70_g1771 [Smittium culicis]
MWYKGKFTADTVKIDLKKKFIETFSDEEVEYNAWNDLIEKDLAAESKTWESAMVILAKEEKYEKIVNTIPVIPTSIKTIVKEIEPIERLILKFDELRLNLNNKEKNSVLPQDNRNRYYENKCSLCNRVGHKSDTLRIVEPEYINKGEFVHKEKPRIKERRLVDIKLSESSSPCSIVNNLSEAKADLSLSQILQVEPSVRKELMGLCKRVELKEIGELGIEERTNTNCRGLISIFNERHWEILDKGAACSVMSESLMISLGLEVYNSDDQIIVTADGTRHNPLGTISKLPIKIANYSLPVDFLVLKIKKTLLILGTDCFSKYNDILDLKSKELVLEAHNADIVLKIYTNTPHRRVHEDVEIFGIGVKFKESMDNQEISVKISEVIDYYQQIFVNDLNELT